MPRRYGVNMIEQRDCDQAHVTTRPLRLLYISQWFEPEPILKGASFVKGLESRGYHVQSITGFPHYPHGKVYPGYRLTFHKHDMAGGVPVERVLLYPNHSRSSILRIVNYFSFAFSAGVFGALRSRQFDVAYVYPPIPAALATAAVCALRRRPYVMDIQDLWPDSVVSSGMPGVRWMERAIHMLCRIAYRRAAMIVAQSQGIADRLIERGVPRDKIHVIYNWAHEDVPAPQIDQARYGFEGRFNIVYAGNLGIVQGLDTLIEATKIAARSVPNIRLTLIGNGVEADRLRDLIAHDGSDYVQLLPAVPRETIGDVLASADVLTLHLVRDPLFAITVPHKTQTYLSAGKPVLAAVEGEAARIVVESGAGLAAQPENSASIADAMVAFATMTPAEREAMGQRARDTYGSNFSFAAALEKTDAVLRTAMIPVGE
ncbi:glycosyltransferase involved in cell wall biosynthesis [Sphingobium wenxiniae]|uniref:Glycosyltransferase involved in cell wall biosynthesis n=2 Tax=Sphingobium wenxiniae (strain DSM 21828 / CGMCC 1.7748 / JZ-1) TaxID=595605 RepID=A0A562K5L6_SPHWJ|nr:glycosyltransferase involved in cell wall biosynthesis [Sphingobium wenxiniae]